MTVVSGDQIVAPNFDCVDLRHTIVPLIILLASFFSMTKRVMLILISVVWT